MEGRSVHRPFWLFPENLSSRRTERILWVNQSLTLFCPSLNLFLLFSQRICTLHTERDRRPGVSMDCRVHFPLCRQQWTSRPDNFPFLLRRKETPSIRTIQIHILLTCCVFSISYGRYFFLSNSSDVWWPFLPLRKFQVDIRYYFLVFIWDVFFVNRLKFVAPPHFPKFRSWRECFQYMKNEVKISHFNVQTKYCNIK